MLRGDSPVHLVLMEGEGHEEGENSLDVKDWASVEFLLGKG